MVVAVGVTLTDPLAANVPSPFRVTDVVLLALHCSTADDPLAMVPGWALNVSEGFCAFGATDGAAEAPPQPKAAPSSTHKNAIRSRMDSVTGKLLQGNLARVLHRCDDSKLIEGIGRFSSAQ